MTARTAPATSAFVNFDTLPDAALIRVGTVAQILGVSRPTIWRWSRAKVIPAPFKLAANTTVWRVSDIRKVLAGSTGGAK